MKQLTTILAFILLSIGLQAQNKGNAIVELFLFNTAPEYDSILKIMDQGGYDYVVYHDHRGDTLECKDVIRLMDLRLTLHRPCAYVNGYRIENFEVLDPTRYQSIVNRTGLYSDKLYAETKWIPILNALTVNLWCDNATGTRMMAMIVESFPGTRYNNVLRSLLIDTLYYGGEIRRAFMLQKNWIPENCKLVVINETMHGQILSCKITEFREEMSGREEVPLIVTAYPNPVSSMLTVQSDKPLSFIRMINSAGMVIDSRIVEDSQYQYDMSDLPEGLYYVQTENKTFKIIKN